MYRALVSTTVHRTRHCNCNHMLFSESSQVQEDLAQDLKQFVERVAVVTVCWSYEL